jgi:hypothetical protein
MANGIEKQSRKKIGTQKCRFFAIKIIAATACLMRVLAIICSKSGV